MQYQNILLIDDDKEDQEIFNDALGKISQNLHCISLASAKEALEKLQENELNPDVIFIDLNMPVMTGQEFLKEIKSSDQLRHIPVIIFSTSSSSSTIATTKLLGANNFITKPNKFSDLVELLKPVFLNP